MKIVKHVITVLLTLLLFRTVTKVADWCTLQSTKIKVNHFKQRLEKFNQQPS